MSRNAKIAVAVVSILFVALLLYSSLRLGQVTMEVCIDFKGRSGCGTAAAPTEEEALRTAQDNACALIAFGREEALACSRTPPVSVRRLED